MKTFGGIMEEVNRQVQGTYDPATYIDWLNSGLVDLSEVLYLPTTLVLAAEPDGTFLLPDNFKNDLRVLPTGDQTFMQQVQYDELLQVGYAFYNNTIYIRNRTGVTELTVMFNRYPEQMTNDPISTPDLPAMYHTALVEWCKAQAMLYEEEVESDERYQHYLSNYLRFKDQARARSQEVKSNSSGAEQWKVVR